VSTSGLKPLAIAGLLLAGVVLASVVAYLAWRKPGQQSAHTDAVPDYVDSTTCSGCHQQIFQSYGRTGMGRSISRPDAGNTVEDYRARNKLYNKASDRHYEMSEREGKLYQRRHQIGFDGRETNVIEKEVDLVIGSGNHARSYLHRGVDGKLFQLPVSWYSEQGGYWAMSPGYDRLAQPDFRRALTDECLFCHASYPPPGSNSGMPKAIDCQRCHGPGGAHVQAAGLGKANRDAVRRMILNPARLSRDGQMETCMQCHLETTSRELPHSIRRYDRSPFSFRPGEPLGDYTLAFDHAPAAGRDDKFEIAHAAWRLRKSACFRLSQMTCTTCHDPHREYDGAQAISQYIAACVGCHTAAHAAMKPSPGNCMECHMPKRRAEDAVHVVMTDHYIQRQPRGNLLAPLKEESFSALDSYRGEVILYYPPQLPTTPDAQLYLDVAQVRDRANLATGILRLQRDLEKYSGGRPEFHFETRRGVFRRR
jgi:predicted CXXCH cytochrome family protein